LGHSRVTWAREQKPKAWKQEPKRRRAGEDAVARQWLDIIWQPATGGDARKPKVEKIAWTATAARQQRESAPSLDSSSSLDSTMEQLAPAAAAARAAAAEQPWHSSRHSSCRAATAAAEQS
jgi:hypothetical protein